MTFKENDGFLKFPQTVFVPSVCQILYLVKSWKPLEDYNVKKHSFTTQRRMSLYANYRFNINRCCKQGIVYGILNKRMKYHCYKNFNKCNHEFTVLYRFTDTDQLA